jgi:signal peptidase
MNNNIVMRRYCMKLFLRILSIGVYLMIFILLAAAVGSAITKQPMLMSAVRSNSMYPLLERGDAVFIKKLAPKDVIKNGDIVVFKTENGSYASQGWIMHRIIEGDIDKGYITKGDANKYIDQELGGTGPIIREWISSRAVTIGGFPIKFPLIGYIPLYMEKFQENPYTLPVIAIILAIIVGISEITGNKKNKRKKHNLELTMIYFFSGFTIAIVVGATMLATSQHIIVPYEISEKNKGALMGSSIGILEVGEEVERPLADLSNKGFFPIVATTVSKDKQISFSHDKVVIKPREQHNITMKVRAEKPGKYITSIWVGMFLPFLPANVIYMLASINYWLALFIVSLIPSVPVMLYPLADFRMRRKTIKQIRRNLGQIKRVF